MIVYDKTLSPLLISYTRVINGVQTCAYSAVGRQLATRNQGNKSQETKSRAIHVGPCMFK
jgi:hypothetical protein